MEKGEFHLQGGLTFKRMEEGSVRIRIYEEPTDEAEVIYQMTIDQESWSSAVASVSKRGCDTHTFEEAFNLHNESTEIP